MIHRSQPSTKSIYRIAKEDEANIELKANNETRKVPSNSCAIIAALDILRKSQWLQYIQAN